MRKFLPYILPAALTLFMCVSLERTVVTDGGYDRLYGLPLPYRSNNAGCSGCYEIYVLAMVVDLLFFCAMAMGLVKLLERVGGRIGVPAVARNLGVLISLFWVVIFVLFTSDSHFMLTNQTEYKTTREILKLDLK